MEYINKGELILCPEGKRLLDEYAAILDILHHQQMDVGVRDKSTEMDAERAWDEYTKHREECNECKYII
ncbi:hypothetical protein IH575_00325 [Candidatus Dojkabacteria bacterium]|nr:hypothetical protein [Candidatus Dojkabacteria bacterium]